MGRCFSIEVLLIFSLFILACEETPQDALDCGGTEFVTITFSNQTGQEQSFDINYLCQTLTSHHPVIAANQDLSLQIQISKNPGTINTDGPLKGCDLTVLWQSDPISSIFQVIYPASRCYPGDRFRTNVNNGESYSFQIIDKPPCSELNKNFSLAIQNKLDTTVHIFMESGSVNFYSGTVSQTYNPRCNPVMCCQYAEAISPQGVYNLTGAFNVFKIHSLGYDAAGPFNFGNLITLFDPSNGMADSIVTVEVHGIVLDSLKVTYSN